MSERIGMVSLGCAKNQVNAEQILFLLQQAGFEVTGDPDGRAGEQETSARVSHIDLGFRVSYRGGEATLSLVRVV